MMDKSGSPLLTLTLCENLGTIHASLVLTIETTIISGCGCKNGRSYVIFAREFQKLTPLLEILDLPLISCNTISTRTRNLLAVAMASNRS